MRARARAPACYRALAGAQPRAPPIGGAHISIATALRGRQQPAQRVVLDRAVGGGGAELHGHASSLHADLLGQAGRRPSGGRVHRQVQADASKCSTGGRGLAWSLPTKRTAPAGRACSVQQILAHLHALARLHFDEDMLPAAAGGRRRRDGCCRGPSRELPRPARPSVTCQQQPGAPAGTCRPRHAPRAVPSRPDAQSRSPTVEKGEICMH